MKPGPIILGLMAAAILMAGCVGCQSQRQPARDAENAQVVEAIRQAHGLEAELFRSPGAAVDRKAVYRHFRRGFSHDLAMRLTEHVWIGGEIGLRPGEPVMAVPEEITVTAVSDSRATAVFSTPPWMMEAWGFGRYTIVSLMREDGRWIITGERGTQQPHQ